MSSMRRLQSGAGRRRTWPPSGVQMSPGFICSPSISGAPARSAVDRVVRRVDVHGRVQEQLILGQQRVVAGRRHGALGIAAAAPS